MTVDECESDLPVAHANSSAGPSVSDIPSTKAKKAASKKHDLEDMRGKGGHFKCPDCGMMGPSSETLAKRCKKCQLCETCCTTGRHRRAGGPVLVCPGGRPSSARLEVGDKVRLVDPSDTDGELRGTKTGTIYRDDGSSNPYKVEVDGVKGSHWYRPHELKKVVTKTRVDFDAVLRDPLRYDDLLAQP